MQAPNAAADRTNLVCVAQVGGAHGVRGEVRVKAFTADPLALKDYSPLQAEDGRRFSIVSARAAKDMLVVRFEGIENREAVEALRHLRLYVPRERLPPAEEDEFYHADLIGLAVVDTAGTELGTIVAVPNYGAGDLLEIAPAGGGPTVLLPFTKTTVPHVDLSGRKVSIDPPEGSFGPPDETS
jgi:16S rRNA processing protein RimM